MNTYYKYKANLIDIILIFLGCIISSLGVNFFYHMQSLLSGGATGIRITFTIYNWNTSWNSSTFFNIPLLTYKL